MQRFVLTYIGTLVTYTSRINLTGKRKGFVYSIMSLHNKCSLYVFFFDHLVAQQLA